jgi:chromosome segregation ATPase
MPSTLAPAAAQPEPTLRDILDAVNGLGTEVAGLKTRFDGLEKRFDVLETRFDGLEKRFDGLETRFDGLEKRIDGLEAEVGHLRTEVAALTALSHEQFAHTTGEISALKAEGAEVRKQLEVLDRRTSEMHAEVTKIGQIEHTTILTRSELDGLSRVMRRIEPQVAETLKLGQDNRTLGQKLQEDVARLDRKFDRHLDDREIHLPRPRTLDLPEAGPIAA